MNEKTSSTLSLKELLARPGQGVVAPGIYDALSAVIAEQAGFECLYLSGASLAYTRLGRPDLGLMAVSEILDTLALIRERVDLPLIVDGDTGFGNALNVRRTVRQFERAGANAIQIEDQSFPKRCGHLKGKSLVDSREMEGKIRAAVDARESDDFLVIARTDAIAVSGLDDARRRADRYIAAGADVLFIEAPTTLEQLTALGHDFGCRIPLVANMVEGGRTPLMTAAQLFDLGYRVVIFPGGAVRAVLRQLQGYYNNLQQTGTNAAFSGNMAQFAELNEIIGIADEVARAEKYT
jgi:2-methylisocitrate lyase-like PEP mutase family enzyme